MTVVQGYKVEIINVVNAFNNHESNRGKKVKHLSSENTCIVVAN